LRFSAGFAQLDYSAEIQRQFRAQGYTQVG